MSHAMIGARTDYLLSPFSVLLQYSPPSDMVLPQYGMFFSRRNAPSPAKSGEIEIHLIATISPLILGLERLKKN